MDGRLEILKSKLFLTGLVLLLLNDFYLKAEYGNWLTGKLSDIAGLFVFPLFLTALLPKQKNLCFLVTACLFVFWKLPASDPLLLAANSLGIGIGRTVDPVDLLALLVLPLAYLYEKRTFTTVALKPQFIGLVAVFAFCATTVPPRQERKFIGINRTYEFGYSKEELVERLNAITIKELKATSGFYDINFDSEKALSGKGET